MKDVAKTILFIIVFILLMMVIFRPSEKDRKAYEKCLQTYDSKTCQKMIFGNYGGR